jgi:hypothetical protein
VAGDAEQNGTSVRRILQRFHPTIDRRRRALEAAFQIEQPELEIAGLLAVGTESDRLAVRAAARGCVRIRPFAELPDATALIRGANAGDRTVFKAIIAKTRKHELIAARDSGHAGEVGPSTEARLKGGFEATFCFSK